MKDALDLSNLVTSVPIIDKQVKDYVMEKIWEGSRYGQKMTATLQGDNPGILFCLMSYFKDETSLGRGVYIAISAYEMLKMKGDLPRVTFDTITKTLKEYLNSNKNEYVVSQLALMRKKDPVLADFVNELSERFDNPLPALEGGILTYRLLEKQAEINKLKIN